MASDTNITLRVNASELEKAASFWININRKQPSPTVKAKS